jgi:prephenate dehydrogenase
MAFQITVVGLGLMGGSMAMALRGFRDARIVGIDVNEASLEKALEQGVIDEGLTAPAGPSDLWVLCLYPRDLPGFVEKNRTFFTAGTVVTDIAGVKGSVLQNIPPLLPAGVDFVGGHPMAGLEVWGFDHAKKDLFQGCNYIVIPDGAARPESVELVRAMAHHIGASRIVSCTPEEHDRNIAYTSQLMHVLAAALCDNPDFLQSKGFEGGSFRGATRVAILNDRLWPQLFMENRDALMLSLDRLIESLSALREDVAKGDEVALGKAMILATERMKKWQKRQV